MLLGYFKIGKCFGKQATRAVLNVVVLQNNDIFRLERKM